MPTDRKKEGLEWQSGEDKMKVTGDGKRRQRLRWGNDGIHLSWLHTSCRDSQTVTVQKMRARVKGQLCKENKECSTSIHERQKHHHNTEMTQIMSGDGRRDIRKTHLTLDKQIKEAHTYETQQLQSSLCIDIPAGLHLWIQIRHFWNFAPLHSETFDYRHKVWSTWQLIQ